jgi:hypothetical protein
VICYKKYRIEGNLNSSLPQASHANGMLFLFQLFNSKFVYNQRMMKLILYTVLLVAFFPLASSADAKSDHHKYDLQRINALKNVSEGEDDDIFPDSLRSRKDLLPLQDTTQYDRRKRIKEVPNARPQPKPERIGERPAPDNGDNNRPPVMQRGNGRPPEGINPNNGMGGGNRMPGGNGGGQGGGRSGPPPAPPGRGR